MNLFGSGKLVIWLKKNIIYLVLLIIIILLILLIIPTKENIKFELYGSSEVTVYKGSEYYEFGYKLANNDYIVKVLNNVDTSILGTYTIRYQVLDKNGKLILEKTRKVRVVEDPLKDISLTLNGDSVEYLLINNYYQDPGAKAISNGIDLSKTIVKTGEVNSNVVGNYELKYTIKVGEVTKSITRLVRVFDIIFESEVDYQNKLIDINVASYDFDYVLLPDKSHKEAENFTYNYSKSDSYYFTVFTKKGYSKIYEVKVLDKIKPVAACEAKINGLNTEVVIDASDESGINYYEYGTLKFYQNKFTINGNLSKFTIRVYDNSNNYIDVQCETKKKFDNNMNEIVVSNELTPCHNDWSNYNLELANLVKEYGAKTRDAVAASAEYLAKFPFKVAYSWGGKYKKPGLNSEWGCSKEVSLHDGRLVCTMETGSNSCIYGMDCTGYTAWAYINAGFDSSIIRTSSQSTGMWGNFNASKHKYSFKNNQDKVNLIKPGDIVHIENHVGIVLGTDSELIKVANMTDGIKITYIKKANGKSINNGRSFDNFVLMDDFFEMYGIK